MKFIRRDYLRYSKLGKNRKKLQKWRKPKGRDNKMRESRKGYPAVVSVGYKKPSNENGRINGKIPFRVLNVKDLSNVGKDQIVILGSVGAKKKMDIIKRAKEMKLDILLPKGGKNNAN